MQFRLITAVLASVVVSGVVAGPVVARDEQVQQDVQAPQDVQAAQEAQAPHAAQADPPGDGGLGGFPGADLAASALNAAKPVPDTPTGGGGGGGGGFFNGLVPDTINVNYIPPNGGGSYCFNNPYAPGCGGGGGGNYCFNNPYAPGCGGGGNYCFNNPYAPGCRNNNNNGDYCFYNPRDPFCQGYPPGPAPRRTPPGCPAFQESCNFCNFGRWYQGNSFIGEDLYVCPNQYGGYGPQYIGCSCYF